MKCGKPIQNEEREFCMDCAKTHFSYEVGRSLYLHSGPVLQGIYQFKFHNKRIFGKYFAKELAVKHGSLLKKWGIREIIPVPLYPGKQRRRGYNQAEVLATHLGRAVNVPVNANVVYRVKNTKPQKELNDKERRRNLKSAFGVSKEWRPIGNVLILDDIYTTGSTIDTIAVMLKKRGDLKVYFLTISIGQGL